MLLLLLLLLSQVSGVGLCATPETAAHQAPPSLGFSRQEHRSGVPLPSPFFCISIIKRVFFKIDPHYQWFQCGQVQEKARVRNVMAAVKLKQEVPVELPKYMRF